MKGKTGVKRNLTVEQTCICGITFVGNANSKYCSRECAAVGARIAEQNRRRRIKAERLEESDRTDELHRCMSIAEVVRLACSEQMSYGKCVLKYGL